MPTLVYTPRIAAHVETTTGRIDISEDIVGGTIILRENAPHTISLQLQNAQRKYDGRLLPMDKISVQLKRLNWVQVFTGYLNDPPIFQAWPGTISFSATCTLKIPQFFYTDTTTAAFQDMVFNALGKNIDERAAEGDNGLHRVIQDSLVQILGWDKTRIHIGQIPNTWFKWAQKVSDKIGADEAIYQTLKGSYVAAGTVNGATYTIPAGNYGGLILKDFQAKNASIIYSTVKAMQGGDNHAVLVMAIMCSLAESELTNHASPSVPGSVDLPHDDVQSPDHDSAGLFQQRLLYYGPVGKIMDPVTATKAFASRLIPLVHGDPPTYSYGSIIQSVQRSFDNTGNNYQVKLGEAQAIVAELDKVGGVISSTQATVNGGQPIAPPTGAGNKATGSQIAKQAMDLIAAHKTSPIIYNMGGDDPYDTPIDQVKTLDCSSLVDWVYYHTTGTPLGTPRTDVASERPICTPVPLETAKYIQGALLFKATEHVGISLGDGVNHVAAHDKYSDPHLDVNISPIDGNGFDGGGLLPHIDYSTSATSKVGQDGLTQAGIKVTGTAPQLTDVTSTDAGAGGSIGDVTGSPFASLINSVFAAASNQQGLIGDAIGGAAALINDVPYLPWLQNIVNASLRSFCSAPNGDFLSWFPDYFGAWGTAGVMNIERIELQDFQVTWSDQQIVTHQFVIGNLGATILDSASGQVGAASATDDLIALATGTAGIATLDYPEIFNVIYGATAPRGFTKAFMERFGARPDVQQMPNIPHGPAEFFIALYLFMQRWAGQFTAEVPMTFMPELFPGMLLRIPDYGFQCYVQQVTHTFSMGSGGGFATQASVCAPSNTASSSRTDLLSLLPMATGKGV